MVPDIKKRSYTLLSLNSYETLREKTETLNKNLDLCRRYKQETINYVKRITEQYKKGILKYAEYEYILNRHLKGQTLEYWTQHYDVQEKKIKEKIRELRTQKLSPLETQVIRIEKKPEKNFFIYFLGILILSLGIASISYYDISLGNIITGLVTEDQVTSFITSYSPETNPEILMGKVQTFTITTSAPENTTLSIQWYVNNLPIADQNSETFTYTPETLGEYEIKVLVNDMQSYTTQKWGLTVQEKEFILPVENITEPVDELQPENVTEPVEETIPENITEPMEELLPEENITLPENITKPFNETLPENITQPVVELADELIQLPAEINKPVKWIRIIINENQTTQLRVRIPKTATNIKAKKIIQLINEEVKEEIPDDKIIIGTSYSITGLVTAEQPRKTYASDFFKDALRFFKNLFSFTGFITAELETKEVTIDVAAPKYEISYETPQPLIEETELENGKRIRIYSDYDYENITTYTTIKETFGEIRLYWLTNDTKILHEAELIDTDNNNMIDWVQWITPHLSEQTFEILITEAGEQTVEIKNFTTFIPSINTSVINSCPRCKETYESDVQQFCVETNAFSWSADYGGEIDFTIPNILIDSAEVCAYQFLVFHNTTIPDDFVQYNYVEHVEEPLLANPSLETIDETWPSVKITQQNGWKCVDITNILITAIETGKENLYLRWWGHDQNQEHLPYVCFRGPETTLSECDNYTVSGTDDCRPYIRIIEK